MGDMCVDDVAGNEPGRYCSPCDRTALSSRNEGSIRPYIEAC
jgi:hypothetical protein